jgi:hypothetical protein
VSVVDIFTAVTAHASLVGVTSALGAEYRDEMASGSRMVWELTSDTFVKGQRTNMPGAQTREPKNIGTRVAGVRVRVWGEGLAATKTPAGDIAAVEELVRKLLVAVHETCWGSYQVASLDWVAADGAELVQQGRCCDVGLRFDVPIMKDARVLASLAVITSAGMEGTAVLAHDVTAVPSP